MQLRELLRRDSDVMLRPVFTGFVHACQRLQLLLSGSNCQTEPSEDVDQSDGKSYVPEITDICLMVIELTIISL